MKLTKKFTTFLVLFVVIVIAQCLYGYWLHTQHYPSTDDAYLKAHILQVASLDSARVVKLNVKEHQWVRKGSLLFRLDPAQFQIAVRQASAKLANTMKTISALREQISAQTSVVEQQQASSILANQQFKRISNLARAKQASRAELDNATASKNEALALLHAAQNKLDELKLRLGKDNGASQINEVRSVLAQAELNLKHTKVFAATAGTVENLHLRVGSFVQAGAPLFAIIDQAHWWIEANFKETQLQRLKVGQPVKVAIDMYPGKAFTGKVASLSAGSGDTFSLLPAENASGNWVKVTQRFPVRIVLGPSPQATPFRVGASSTVTVDTTHG